MWDRSGFYVFMFHHSTATFQLSLKKAAQIHADENIKLNVIILYLTKIIFTVNCYMCSIVVLLAQFIFLQPG